MTETLILHLGLHKTATTALQDFLASESRALLARGAACPRLARMRSDVTPLLVSATRGDRAALGRFVEKNRQRVLLLSDENILGAPGDILGGALYPYAENRIRRVVEQFPGLRVRLFLTLRSPAGFLASLYCEYLRHNAWRSFAEYVAGYDLAGFSYAETFGWLAELPGNVAVTVTPFEATKGGGIPVITGRLLEAACGPQHGIDLAGFPETRSRASFTVEELSLAEEIAARAHPRTAQLFLSMLDTRDRRFGATRFEPLPSAAAAALEARYDAELTGFFARLPG
jgi:hypothetical protein